MQQPDWLAWAWREFGVHEVAGSGDNPRIVAMFKAVGHAAVKDDEVAWCAAFVGACLERSSHASTRSLMARSYLRWGSTIGSARYGAIAVLSRGADPALGHVGFVVGETEAEVLLLGGNQSNGVNVAAFPKTRVLDFRWPEGQNEPTLEPAAKDGERRDEGDDLDLFGRALRHVLDMEGGFSDDPYDPGGPTNKGITLDVYARWVGEQVSTATRSRLVGRLKRIPDAMVGEIYKTRYWERAECARLPGALALMHFDAAVNHGVGRAARILQEAVGADVDGEIGPLTRARVAAKPIVEALISYAEIRREHYRSLKHFWRFGRGWMRRVDVTLVRSGMLMGGPARAASPARPQQEFKQDNVEHAANEKDQTHMSTENTGTPAPAKWWGESMTIWGVIVTAASTVLPVIAPLLGLDITADMVQQIGQQMTEVVQALGGVIGTLLAIYGRVRATQPIARKLVAVKL